MKSQNYAGMGLSGLLLLGACTATPSTSGGTLPAILTEAPATTNPKYPGIAAMIWTFRDGSQAMCGINRDKGAIETSANLAQQFARLADGKYSYKIISQNDAPLVVVIDGQKTYGLQNDGVLALLKEDDAQPLQQGFLKLRTTCTGLVQATDELATKIVGSLQSKAIETVTFGPAGQVAQLQILAY